MKSFIANPKTQKIESVDGDPGTGLYSYRYDEKKIRKADIKEMLRLTNLILGTLEDTNIILSPLSVDEAEVILSIKNRSNMKLGIHRLK